MKSLQINKETVLFLKARGQSFLSRLPRVLLVDHVRLVKLFIILALFAAAVYIVVSLLYVKPDTATSPSAREVTLQTSVIDELEVWLEERQGEREEDIVPSGDYFVD